MLCAQLYFQKCTWALYALYLTEKSIQSVALLTSYFESSEQPRVISSESLFPFCGKLRASLYLERNWDTCVYENSLHVCVQGGTLYAVGCSTTFLFMSERWRISIP